MAERTCPNFTTHRILDILSFRHVAKTGDIKGFVITEESGIAKGIRRIVAVTGHEAQEVTREAELYEERLRQLEGLDGKSKDAALKALTVVSADLSFHERGLLRRL